jgi:hypothetical protein
MEASNAINPRQMVQIVTMLTSVAGILAWISIVWIYRNYKYIVAAPIALLVHTLIYYSAAFYLGFAYNPTLFGDWSAGLRLHGITTTFLIALQLKERAKHTQSLLDIIAEKVSKED